MNTGFLVIPVYNEEQVFAKLLPSLLRVSEVLGVTLVIVDDGSRSVLRKNLDVLRLMNAHAFSDLVFLRHAANLGVGAAIETGVRYARAHGAEWVLTMDGDGQHDPKDLMKLAEQLSQGVQLVNGSRFLRDQEIPLFRRLANRFANVLQRASGGGTFTDTQSGMKGLGSEVLDSALDLPCGYEWSSELLRRAYRQRFIIAEVDISVSYSLYSLSKGQCFAQGFDMLLRFLCIPLQWFFGAGGKGSLE